MSELPIACTLSPQDLVERRAVLAALQAHCLQITSLDARRGLALSLASTPGILATVARIIDLERECCRFLEFELCVEANGGPVGLTMRGPEGTTEFLGEELGLVPFAA